MPPFLQYVRQSFSVSLSVWQTLTNPSVTIYFWSQSHTLTFSLNLLHSPLGFLFLFLFLLQAHSMLEWHSRNCQNNPVFEDEYFTAWRFWKAQPANLFFFFLTIWNSWSARLLMKLDHGGDKRSKDTVKVFSMKKLQRDYACALPFSDQAFPLIENYIMLKWGCVG